MPRPTRLLFSIALGGMLIFFAACPKSHAQGGNQAQGGIRQQRAYLVSGYVTKGSEGAATADGARVELRSLGGATIATTMTSGNGNFVFPAVANGEYYLFVSLPGYDELTQPVAVDEGPVTQIRIELHRTREAGSDDIVGGPPTVSARELSIPHKAHDAFQKGMLLLYGKNDLKGSVKEFQKAVQEFPGYYEAYTQIGIAQMRLGDSAASETAFRKAIDASSGAYSDAYSYFALLLCTNQRYKDAEPLARKAVDLDKNSWVALTELVRSLFGQDRFEEAEGYGLEAVKLQPQEPTLRLMLADIHLKLRNYPEAANDLNGYLKLAPEGAAAARAKQLLDRIQDALANTPAAEPAPAQTTPAPNP